MDLKDYLKEASEPTLAEYEKLVGQFDLTYSYSDDHSSWRRGEAQAAKLRELRAELIKLDKDNEEKCIKIWNDNVDKKIVASARQEWYASKSKS